MTKNYTLEFLYDNGITEQFQTEAGTEEDINEVLSVIKDAIRNDTKGIMSLKDKNGNKANLNISKITRFTVISD